MYFNPDRLQPDNLHVGDSYWPAGCTEDDCAKTFGGGRVRMDQIVAEFRLRPDVRWSDGQPVVASDSIFSFRLDADPDTPSPKFLVDRTYSYEAVDERTVQWTGVPGLRDGLYASSFWSPLPEHRLGAIAASDIAAAEAAARAPLGWGPYRVEEWRPGSQITLGVNPEYFRAAEGLPKFERLIFRFVREEAASGLDQLRTEECDVLDESVLEAIPLADVVSAGGAGDIEFSAASGPMEWLEFRVGPSADGTALPLADPRTRRGLAQCVDRPGMIEQFTFGISPLPSTYLPPEHPDFVAPADPIAHNPEAGRALLEEAGWVDDGSAATARRSRGVSRVADGTELALRLGTSDDVLHTGMAAALRENLAACGARLEIQSLPAASLLAPWPEGPALSGQFDLILWAWPVLHSPPCEMFAGWQIPGEGNPEGVNASGWSDAQYD
ncbi:MAG: ABC transporter substrate-binding protein, partial [Anaerolineales bacterium]